MRSALLALGLSAALFSSSPAFAQFANRSIGLSAGYLKLNAEGGLDWGVPVGIFYSTYLDSNFELVAHVHGMLLRDPVKNQLVIGLAPAIGFRYLFSQEHVRPYVGLDISYLHIFYDPDNTTSTTDYVGIGPHLGIDFFVSDQWSVGLRAQYNLYVMINKPLNNSLGATVEIATYY